MAHSNSNSQKCNYYLRPRDRAGLGGEGETTCKAVDIPHDPSSSPKQGQEETPTTDVSDALGEDWEEIHSSEAKASIAL